jgi:hypothetical protein
MSIADAYRYEMEMKDGAVIECGDDLKDCMRFSLIPGHDHLPRHDIVGIPMKRRFGRGFIKVNAGGLREYVHCVVCEDCRLYVRSSDGTVLVTPPDYELYL